MTCLREWLEHEPLQSGEQLFAVLGSTSDCEALAAWRRAGGGSPSPIWAGSEYADWKEVMPFVSIVAVDSAFLDWVAECEGDDWGWLAVSTCPLQTVIEHLRGLTKVHLPEGQTVFFRFWDGAYLLPVLQALGLQAGKVIPVFRRYWIHGQSHEVAVTVAGVARKSPWWKVPAPVLKRLEERSAVTLVDNLLQWLEEQRSDLHGAVALTTLRHKVAYFVRGPNEGHQALAAYLSSELGKPSDHGPAPLPV
jgi:hypothetical protein